MVRMKSSASADVLLDLQHLPHPCQACSSSLSSLVTPALYFQCAAMPYSAVWCISQVRICTSKGMPSLPMTVVCSDWYMLGLGVEI